MLGSFRILLGYIEPGVKEGARIAHGGNARPRGFYVEPTILDGANNRLRIAQGCRSSGPSSWSRSARRGAAHRLSRAIRVGAVCVNTYDRSTHAIDKSVDFKTIWTSYR